VELENLPAAEALAAVAAADQTKASLDAAIADGQMSREEANAELAGMETLPRRRRRSPSLWSPPAFTWLVADGTPSPWSPKLATPEGPAVPLDGKEPLSLSFVVPPETTQATAPGEYHLRLRYSGAGAPAGEWAGTADSEEGRHDRGSRPGGPRTGTDVAAAYAFSLYHLPPATSPRCRGCGRDAEG